MYGLSDQSNGIPLTRFSAHLARLFAVLHPHPGTIEHTFVSSVAAVILAGLIRVDDELPPSTHAPESGA